MNISNERIQQIIEWLEYNDDDPSHPMPEPKTIAHLARDNVAALRELLERRP